jgi:hypothetical protein
MEHAPAPLLGRIATWPATAQAAGWHCRTLFHDVAKARGVGPLAESLKWGQPAWRPRRPRTGSTLRMDWSAQTPDRLNLYVDCKTDLARRLSELHPECPFNDGQRQLAFDLAAPLPDGAIAALAGMTFCYHLDRRPQTQIG